MVSVGLRSVCEAKPGKQGPIDEDFPRGGGRGYGNYKAAKELVLEA